MSTHSTQDTNSTTPNSVGHTEEYNVATQVVMEGGRPRGPNNNRKRATKACLACRARKVRCDVSQRGQPCMNCFLDSESCVVTGRASKRKRTRAVAEKRSSETTEDITILREMNSLATKPVEAPAVVVPGYTPNIDSVGCKSSGLETLPRPFPELSGDHIEDGARKPQPCLHNGAPTHPHPHEGQQNTTAGTEFDPLQWVGERNMKFGSDIIYTFYPFLSVNNLSNIMPQDVSYLEMQGCFRVPTKPILDEFVKQFFLHVHPIIPLLNEGDFWEFYNSPSTVGPGSETVSLLVLQAMMFSACRYISRSAIRALGFSDMRATRSAFYRRAKLLFDFESESSPIIIAQAALLLSSWLPNSGNSRSYTGITWLTIAIQHAKLAEAHRYASIVPTHWSNAQSSGLRKHQNNLKRLWWSIIMYDRALAISCRRPIQVTRAHFDLDLEKHAPLDVADMADEIERSRVYNPGTRKLLIEIFAQMTKLAVALTDLLVVVWPLDDAPRWEKRFGDEDIRKIEDCKIQMLKWYEEASVKFPIPTDTGTRRNEGRRTDFRHDSVILYTNLMYISYHSAMTRLCHHECLQLTLASISTDCEDMALSVKSAMTKNRLDIQDAASGTVDCLKEVLRFRLSRWLPLSSTAFASLPLMLHIIEAKLSPQANIKLHGLRDLVDSFRPDTTDWLYGAIHDIIGLAQLEDPGPIGTVAPTDLTLGEISSSSSSSSSSNSPGGSLSELGSHPSIYLRLALTMDWGIRNSSEAPNADQLSSCLLRLFATSSVNRIKTILNRGRQIVVGSPSDVFLDETTAVARPVCGEQDEYQCGQQQQQQQKYAEWSDQDRDQAVLFGLQLEILPHDLAMGWAVEDVVTSSPESVPTEDGMVPPFHSQSPEEEIIQEANWKEIAGQAFSDTVDIPEKNVLDAFIFRDQLPGEEQQQQQQKKKQQQNQQHVVMKNNGEDIRNYEHESCSSRVTEVAVQSDSDVAMSAMLLDAIGSEPEMDEHWSRVRDEPTQYLLT